MAYPIFPDVKKIAVFRALVLGDFLFALPALAALHVTYPQAEMTYLGRDWHTRFVPGRLSGAHRVIAIPPARGEQIAQGLVIEPQAEVEIIQALRAERFDLVLQMHGAGEYSNPFVLQLGARFTAGLKSQCAAPLDRWTPYIYYQNEVIRMLDVAALAGASQISSDLTPRLPVLESDLQAAASVLEELPGPFAVFHPGSTDPRRCWAPENFAAVGDACAALGLQVILTGTTMESARIQAIQAAMQAPVLNLCDRLPLPGLVGLLSRARLFLGNDSGPLHLALAVGAPSIGLFWSEYILNSMPLERARFRPLIAWRRTCPQCGCLCGKAEIDQPSGLCTHAVSFIGEITPAAVISEIEALLATTLD